MQNLAAEHEMTTVEADAVPWYALYTRHQHEKLVAEILSKKGFEVFLPLYEAAHRWKDRTKLLTLPLFPSYVFLRGGLDRQLHIVTTPGVHSIVAIGSRAAAIPEAEITAVRRTLESSARVEPHPFLKCGDRVRVVSGPLEGIEGILTRVKNLFRLVISVEMLQKSVAVEVEASIVERVLSVRPSLSGAASQHFEVPNVQTFAVKPQNFAHC